MPDYPFGAFDSVEGSGRVLGEVLPIANGENKQLIDRKNVSPRWAKEQPNKRHGTPCTVCFHTFHAATEETGYMVTQRYFLAKRTKEPSAA